MGNDNNITNKLPVIGGHSLRGSQMCPQSQSHYELVHQKSTTRTKPFMGIAALILSFGPLVDQTHYHFHHHSSYGQTSVRPPRKQRQRQKANLSPAKPQSVDKEMPQRCVNLFIIVKFISCCYLGHIIGGSTRGSGSDLLDSSALPFI